MEQYKGAIIYMLQADNGPVKIGTASDTQTAEARIIKFQTGNHHELKCIRTISGSYKSERWLHTYFKPLHIRGEWFQYHPTMLTIKIPRAIRIEDRKDQIYRLTEVQYPDEQPEEFQDIIQQMLFYIKDYSFRHRTIFGPANLPEDEMIDFLKTKVAPDKIKAVVKAAERTGKMHNFLGKWCEGKSPI